MGKFCTGLFADYGLAAFMDVDVLGIRPLESNGPRRSGGRLRTCQFPVGSVMLTPSFASSSRTHWNL